MPALTEHLGLPNNFPMNTCLEIDVNYWGFSNNAPLSTVGALPCMNVVVHRGNVGCLAHVWNTNVSRTENYHRACFTIQTMINDAIGHRDNLNIWLGAGTMFNRFGQAGEHDIPVYGFIRYLAVFLPRTDYPGRTIMDHRLNAPLNLYANAPVYDPGSIVYNPPTGCVYLIQRNKLDPNGFTDDSQRHSVQTGNHPAQHYHQCI